MKKCQNIHITNKKHRKKQTSAIEIQTQCLKTDNIKSQGSRIEFPNKPIIEFGN